MVDIRTETGVSTSIIDLNDVIARVKMELADASDSQRAARVWELLRTEVEDKLKYPAQIAAAVEEILSSNGDLSTKLLDSTQPHRQAEVVSIAVTCLLALENARRKTSLENKTEPMVGSDSQSENAVSRSALGLVLSIRPDAQELTLQDGIGLIDRHINTVNSIAITAIEASMITERALTPEEMEYLSEHLPLAQQAAEVEWGDIKGKLNDQQLNNLNLVTQDLLSGVQRANSAEVTETDFFANLTTVAKRIRDGEQISAEEIALTKVSSQEHDNRPAPDVSVAEEPVLSLEERVQRMKEKYKNPQ